MTGTASEATPLASATTEFRRAVRQAPDNLAATIRLGAVYERQGQYFDALWLYVRFAREWGRVYETRYRLAAVLSVGGALAPARTGIDAPSAKREPTFEFEFTTPHQLARVLRERFGDAADMERVEQLDVDQFRRLARLEWQDLSHFLSLPRSWARLLHAMAPWTDDDDATYQRRFVRPGRARRDRVVLARLGELATEIQLAVLDEATAITYLRTRIEWRLGRQRRRGAACLYGAAGCYSRLYELSHDAGDAHRAIALLKEVVRRGSLDTWIRSIVGDPALAAVRGETEYTLWVADLVPDGRPTR